MPRPPRPTHLKVLAGEREDRINRNAPTPTPTESTITPPTVLSEAAQQIWARLAPDLIDKQVLSSWDADLFGVFCDSAATYYECRERLGGQFAVEGSKSTVVNPLWRVMRDAAEVMARLAGRFGLTPSDRAKIDIGESAETPKYGPERILG